MSLLRRILPITDELTAAKAGVEDVLRGLYVNEDRAAIVASLRDAAARADAAATKARELARAIEAWFGTLPEEPPVPEGAPGVQEDDDGA